MVSKLQLSHEETHRCSCWWLLATLIKLLEIFKLKTSLGIWNMNRMNMNELWKLWWTVQCQCPRLRPPVIFNVKIPDVLKRAPSRSTMTLAVSLRLPLVPLLKALSTLSSCHMDHIYEIEPWRGQGCHLRHTPWFYLFYLYWIVLICIDTLKHPPVPAGLINSFVSLGGNFAWIWEPVTLNVSRSFKDFKASSGHLTGLQSEAVCLSVSGECTATNRRLLRRSQKYQSSKPFKTI